MYVKKRSISIELRLEDKEEVIPSVLQGGFFDSEVINRRHENDLIIKEKNVRVRYRQRLLIDKRLKYETF